MKSILLLSFSLAVFFASKAFAQDNDTEQHSGLGDFFKKKLPNRDFWRRIRGRKEFVTGWARVGANVEASDCRFSGEKIEKIDKNTGSECGPACNANQACKSYDYVNKKCTLYKNYALRIMAKKAEYGKSYADSLCGFANIKAEEWKTESDGSSIAAKCDFLTKNFVGEIPVADLDECKTKCKDNKECTHYTLKSGRLNRIRPENIMNPIVIDPSQQRGVLDKEFYKIFEKRHQLSCGLKNGTITQADAFSSADGGFYRMRVIVKDSTDKKDDFCGIISRP